MIISPRLRLGQIIIIGAIINCLSLNNALITTIIHLISTYQVSSAKLESQSAQRMKSFLPRPGIEPGFPDCRSGVLVVFSTVHVSLIHIENKRDEFVSPYNMAR